MIMNKMKLVLKAVMLTAMVIGMTPSTTKNMSFAAPAACDPWGCVLKCQKLGALTGYCDVTGNCSCYWPHPGPDGAAKAVANK
jgi:hypothetical protein